VIEIAHALPWVKIESHVVVVVVVDEISPTEEASEDANSSCQPANQEIILSDRTEPRIYLIILRKHKV
jgi:hypothetical protein